MDDDAIEALGALVQDAYHTDHDVATDPDLDDVRLQRFERNKKAMQVVSKSLAGQVVPGIEDESKVEKSVVCIQRHWRGYLGRKEYLNCLLNKALVEEQLQRENTLHQMEEAQLLVDNHKLEVLIDETRTTKKNRHRYYINQVIVIQRAWRTFSFNRRKQPTNSKSLDYTTSLCDTRNETSSSEMSSELATNCHNCNTGLDIHENSHDVVSDTFPVKPPHNKHVNCVETLPKYQTKCSDKLDNSTIDNIVPYTNDNDHQQSVIARNQIDNELLDSEDSENPDNQNNRKNCKNNINRSSDVSLQNSNSCKSTNESVDLPQAINTRHVIDTECESVHSDYSELAAPLRDLDISSQRRDSLRKSPSPGDANIETEAEYEKRMKKINILSLAQEFADLKKVNVNALPFNLHHAVDGSPDSDTSSQTSDSVISPTVVPDSDNESTFVVNESLSDNVNSVLTSEVPNSCDDIAGAIQVLNSSDDIVSANPNSCNEKIDKLESPDTVNKVVVCDSYNNKHSGLDSVISVVSDSYSDQNSDLAVNSSISNSLIYQNGDIYSGNAETNHTTIISSSGDNYIDNTIGNIIQTDCENKQSACNNISENMPVSQRSKNPKKNRERLDRNVNDFLQSDVKNTRDKPPTNQLVSRNDDICSTYKQEQEAAKTELNAFSKPKSTDNASSNNDAKGHVNKTSLLDSLKSYADSETAKNMTRNDGFVPYKTHAKNKKDTNSNTKDQPTSDYNTKSDFQFHHDNTPNDINHNNNAKNSPFENYPQNYSKSDCRNVSKNPKADNHMPKFNKPPQNSLKTDIRNIPQSLQTDDFTQNVHKADVHTFTTFKPDSQTVKSDVQSTFKSDAQSAFKSDIPKNFAKIPKESLPPKNYDAVLTGQDFDVYNIETALPEMDWTKLETRLHEAEVAEKQRLASRRNDREEIRKKLAMGVEDERDSPSFPRKPSLQSRLQTAPNLQICFMNDIDDLAPVYTDPQPKFEPIQPTNLQHQSQFDLPQRVEAASTQTQSQMNGKLGHHPIANGSARNKPIPPVNQSGDFLQQQAVLQAEAKMALAQAGSMAHMQLEVEKQSTKRAPIAEKVGIPQTLIEDKQQKLTWRVLQMMNIAQIQVAVNDLHTQIEALNDELVRLLIERDDLHMEQDSMLVDVEDLTRRAKEISEKVNKKQKKPGRRK